jgi:hypothetical protein
MKTSYMHKHHMLGELHFEFNEPTCPPEREVIQQKLIYCSLSVPNRISRDYNIPTMFDLFRLTAVKPKNDKTMNGLYIRTEFFSQNDMEGTNGKITIRGNFHDLTGHALELHYFSKIHKESEKIYTKLVNNQNQQSLF